MITTVLLGAGAAGAAVTFGVSPSTGLTDGAQVQISMAGINAVLNAAIEISECGNAYGDNSPLVSMNPATDCAVIDRVDVSATPSVVFTENVRQVGIGLGNRSCITAGNFSCDLRVTHMVNQLTSPLPPPVEISFAANAPGATPMATTTTGSVVGAPATVSQAAYVHVVVKPTAPENAFFKPEGGVSVDVDGAPGPSATLGTDGTVNVNIGIQSHGTHTIRVHYAGNGSFASSDSPLPNTPFSVINDDNIAIGDVSVVEGDIGFRKISFPVTLSKPYPGSVSVWYALHAVTTNGSDVTTAISGKLTFPKSYVALYLNVSVLGDTSAEGNETFHIDLSLDAFGKSRDYELRRAQATGTIIDDDSPSPGLVASVGDASAQEGNAGGGHYVKVPLTLSASNLTKTVVKVIVSSGDGVLKAGRLKGGDWQGSVIRYVTFLPGVVRKFVSILEYPDTKDEPNLTVTVDIDSITVATGGFPVGVGRSHGTATILSDE
jgi:Calx-beta domain-containing protein